MAGSALRDRLQFGKKSRHDLIEKTYPPYAIFDKKKLQLPNHLGWIFTTAALLSVVSASLWYTICYVHQFIQSSEQLSLMNLQIKSIGQDAFLDGLTKCSAIDKERQLQSAEPETSTDRRTDSSHGQVTDPILLEHVNLIDGDGQGVIQEVWGQQGSSSMSDWNNKNITKLNAAMKWVTPGLIDMHSHVGTDSWPEFDMTSDTNELSDSPLTPFVRSLDGINPDDLAIKLINSGGVTTSLVLPGSGNLIGGEAFLIKHRNANSVSDLLYKFDKGAKKWRYVKMACGENPISVYGRGKGIMPNSRLGEGWLFRQMFDRARTMMKRQDLWCQKAKYIRDTQAPLFLEDGFPEDMEIELVVGLLRGDVKLNNHCYTTYDMEMMIRHAHEFGFKITTFHHAAEAWRIAPLLSKENISVAIFADLWGYKKEAYGVSVKAAQILSDAGVDVAFKSDHPVTNSQHLIFEAAKAHHHGLSPSLAIQAVTSKPAKALGLRHIGYVRKGYDADLVLWNRFECIHEMCDTRHPLEAGAHPLKVWIDGQTSFTHSLAEQALKKAYTSAPAVTMSNSRNVENRVDGIENYLIYNISIIYSDRKKTFTADNDDLSILVESGKITCLGKNCGHERELLVSRPDFLKINANRGIATPGFVAPYSRLGLEEIEAEKVTKDGKAKGFIPSSGGTRAIDGLKVWKDGSKQLEAAYKAGVLYAVAVPRAKGVVLGRPCVFKTGAQSYDDAIVKEITGVAVAVGENSKDGESITNSLAGQFMLLRDLLSEHKSMEDGFSGIMNGTQALHVELDEASDIARFLQILQDVRTINSHFTSNVTIVGGAEAWVLAKELAVENVDIILRPARCTPGRWSTRRCKIPSSYPSAVDILHGAGVNVVLSVEEDNQTRNILFEAAWAYAESNNPASISNTTGKLTKEDAIGLITWSAAQASGMNDYGMGNIKIGYSPGFLIHQGDPLSLASTIQIIADGKSLTFWPKQL